MKIVTIDVFIEALVNCYMVEIAVRYATDFSGLLKSGYKILKLQNDNPEFWKIVKHDNVALIRKAYRELPKPSESTIQKILDFAHENKKERT